MSHAGMKELLAMRADEASQVTRDHVAGCPRCQAELERLYQVRSRLRSLPSLKPPRDRWPAVREQLVTRRRARRRRGAGLTLLAAATLLVATLASWKLLDLRRDARQQALFGNYVVDLQERSLLLDAELRAVEAEPSVLSGARAAAIAELEDRLAAIDRQLERPADPSERALAWRTRLELQGALIGLRLAPQELAELSTL